MLMQALEDALPEAMGPKGQLGAFIPLPQALLLLLLLLLLHRCEPWLWLLDFSCK